MLNPWRATKQKCLGPHLLITGCVLLFPNRVKATEVELWIITHLNKYVISIICCGWVWSDGTRMEWLHYLQLNCRQVITYVHAWCGVREDSRKNADDLKSNFPSLSLVLTPLQHDKENPLCSSWMKCVGMLNVLFSLSKEAAEVLFFFFLSFCLESNKSQMPPSGPQYPLVAISYHTVLVQFSWGFVKWGRGSLLVVVLELNGAEIKIHLLSSDLPLTSASLPLYAVLPGNHSLKDAYFTGWLECYSNLLVLFCVF